MASKGRRRGVFYGILCMDVDDRGDVFAVLCSDAVYRLSITHLRGPSLSSTPLEVLLFLNGWYCASYFLIEALIFIYKGLILPYPTSNLVLEVVMLFLYLGIEVTRLYLGCQGNQCERKLPLVVSVGLTIPTGLLALYFLFLQTYALRLETVLSCILLFFYGLEAILSCAALITFCREPSY